MQNIIGYPIIIERRDGEEGRERRIYIGPQGVKLADPTRKIDGRREKDAVENNGKVIESESVRSV